MSGRGGGTGTVGVLSRAILSDEEVTIFPESSAVLNLSGTTTVGRGENDVGTIRDGSGDVSLLHLAWWRTESVFYFMIAVVLAVALLCGAWFAYNIYAVRREFVRHDRAGGARWTRLREESR
ncbi:m40 protein [Murid betaherpesvirus 1]|uniref:M40 protein n=1 Tax=Murid herpesvirus 1 TaxID=10366 RepID=H2A275_MUHV1|nr:m40 protein [Murid betaherpesvirus 1]CCE57044.1 m40 protein [Murid betaherpesvirus 1]